MRAWCLLLATSLTMAAAPAAAQPMRPWVPPMADSLARWAADARARFQSNRGDSAAGPNFVAYDRVGRMGHLLLRSLGRDGLPQARAIEPALDSLGLATDVALDPATPGFALVMVRNPFRPAAEAVGFLFWNRGDELRMQGAVFRGGAEPTMRVWWTGQRGQPYAWGVIEREIGPAGLLRLTVFGLAPDGRSWAVAQHEGMGQVLGEPGQASWVEVHGDGVPEIALYTPAGVDSLFTLCAACPAPVHERLFTERPGGFALHDTRVLPSPLVTFILFARALADGQLDHARRFLADPSRLDSAIAEGWGQARGAGRWELEYVENDLPWPRWLAFRFRAPSGERRYIVHFVQKDTRWLIQEWIPVQPGTRPSADAPAGR
jgi:hypothetical protein